MPRATAPADDFDQRHVFTPYANWLVPGHVMLGRYPFLEPSRLDSRPEAERQLEQILRAGITTFVSLQAETPAQQDMPVRGAGGFMPYKAAADLIAAGACFSEGRLMHALDTPPCTRAHACAWGERGAHAGMSGPPPGEIVEGLRNPYLDAFIPARRREAPEAYRNYKPCRPRYVRAPIDDLDVPADTATFDAAVDDLVARLEQGTLARAALSGRKPCWQPPHVGRRGRVLCRREVVHSLLGWTRALWPRRRVPADPSVWRVRRRCTRARATRLCAARRPQGPLARDGRAVRLGARVRRARRREPVMHRCRDRCQRLCH